jgi:DnaJ-class molecular chaperone
LEVDARDAMSDEDELETCRTCGAEMEWERCWQCFGDGEYDLHEEDPVNFAPDETFEPCEECNGRGGYLVCIACRSQHGKRLEA